MNFVADECCDALLVEGLRGDGYDVLYIKDVARGADDDAVLQMAFREQRILLTEDKDFGELVVRLQLPAYAIILLRINPADTDTKLARLRNLLTKDAQRIPGAFTVLDRKKVRFRPLKTPPTRRTSEEKNRTSPPRAPRKPKSGKK